MKPGRVAKLVTRICQIEQYAADTPKGCGNAGSCLPAWSGASGRPWFPLEPMIGGDSGRILVHGPLRDTPGTRPAWRNPVRANVRVSDLDSSPCRLLMKLGADKLRPRARIAAGSGRKSRSRPRIMGRYLSQSLHLRHGSNWPGSFMARCFGGLPARERASVRTG